MSPSSGVGTVNAVIVDSIDPGFLAAFWSELLGLAVSDRNGNDWIDLRPIAAGGPILAFQRVPEIKHVKNRLHLDVRVDDLMPLPSTSGHSVAAPPATCTRAIIRGASCATARTTSSAS